MKSDFATLTCACCGKSTGGSLARLDAAGWNWWTGYLPETQAACPSCAKNRKDQVAALIAASRQKPEVQHGA